MINNICTSVYVTKMEAPKPRKIIRNTVSVNEPVVKSSVNSKIVKKKGSVQKYPTPEKTDALYKFYTSLLRQRPNSEMAMKWCIEHGVLDIAVVLSKEMTKVAIK